MASKLVRLTIRLPKEYADEIRKHKPQNEFVMDVMDFYDEYKDLTSTLKKKKADIETQAEPEPDQKEPLPKEKSPAEEPEEKKTGNKTRRKKDNQIDKWFHKYNEGQKQLEVIASTRERDAIRDAAQLQASTKFPECPSKDLRVKHGLFYCQQDTKSHSPARSWCINHTIFPATCNLCIETRENKKKERIERARETASDFGERRIVKRGGWESPMPTWAYPY